MILRKQNLFVWKGTLIVFVTNSLLILITFGTVHFSKKSKERAVECFYGFNDDYIEKIIGSCEQFLHLIQEDSFKIETGRIFQPDFSDSEESDPNSLKVRHENSLNKSKIKNKKLN